MSGVLNDDRLHGPSYETALTGGGVLNDDRLHGPSYEAALTGGGVLNDDQNNKNPRINRGFYQVR